MRITEQQRGLIKQTANEVFGHPVDVILFGSRVDDTKRGGDIDIMVTTEQETDQPVLLASRLSVRLSRLLDGRKVDVVIRTPTLNDESIHRIAESTGVRL